MFDAILASPVVMSLLCAALAVLVVSPVYMSPFMSGRATPTSASARFPTRTFARAALIAFILLINAASLGLAHRMPVGSTLIAVGFLMLMLLPAEEAVDGQTSGG